MKNLPKLQTSWKTHSSCNRKTVSSKIRILAHQVGLRPANPPKQSAAQSSMIRTQTLLQYATEESRKKKALPQGQKPTSQTIRTRPLRRIRPTGFNSETSPCCFCGRTAFWVVYTHRRRSEPSCFMWLEEHIGSVVLGKRASSPSLRF